MTLKLLGYIREMRQGVIDKKERKNLKQRYQGVSGFFLYPICVLILAVLLTFCDYYCHTRMDVLYYHKPDHNYSMFPRHPTYDVFVGFFGISIFCVVSGLCFFHDIRTIYLDHTLLSVLLFVLQYYFSGLFQEYPMCLHNLFLLTWGLHLYSAFGGSEVGSGVTCAKVAVYSIMLGMLGPVVEGFYSSEIKFFAYNGVVVYHVPVWLCGLYMNGGIAVATTIGWLERCRKNRTVSHTKKEE